MPDIFSPLKGWKCGYNSPKKTPVKPIASTIPKSPSPRKRSTIKACRNISFLLEVRTPEKKPIEDMEELPIFEDEKPEGARPPKLTSKPKRKTNNFIKLNMKKKTFVRGKKNFKKFKRFRK